MKSVAGQERWRVFNGMQFDTLKQLVCGKCGGQRVLFECLCAHLRSLRLHHAHTCRRST